MGVNHLIAVVAIYIIGVLFSFVANKHWVFNSPQNGQKQFIQFVVVYLAALILNLILLYILVDIFGFQHELVQLGLIFVIAGFIFLLNRLWVFKIG